MKHEWEDVTADCVIDKATGNLQHGIDHRFDNIDSNYRLRKVEFQNEYTGRPYYAFFVERKVNGAA